MELTMAQQCGLFCCCTQKQLSEDKNRKMLAEYCKWLSSLQEREHASRAHPSFFSPRNYTELAWNSRSHCSTMYPFCLEPTMLFQSHSWLLRQILNGNYKRQVKGGTEVTWPTSMHTFSTCWDNWSLQGCYQLYQTLLEMLLALPMTVEHCSLLPLWKAVFGASAGPARPESPGSDEWAPWFLKWSPAILTCVAQQAYSESVCTCFVVARAAQG